MLKEFIELFLEQNAAKKRGISIDREETKKKYLGNKHYFSSYTEIDKLGINPRSTYKTPTGVYTYPLIDLGMDGLTGRVPYVGTQPHIQVLYSDLNGIVEVGEDGKALVDDEMWGEKAKQMARQREHSSFGTVQSRVKRELLQELPATIHQGKRLSSDHPELNDHYLKCLRTAQEIVDNFEEEDWPLDKIGALADALKGAAMVFMRMFKKIYADDSEPPILIQMLGVLFAAEATAINLSRRIREAGGLLYKGHEEAIEAQVQEFISRTKIKTGFGLFWNATRLAASGPKNWTRILLSHGIRGVVDHGSSLIHDAEPHQAVFFDPRAYRHVDSFANPNAKGFSKIRKISFDDGSKGTVEFALLSSDPEHGRVITKTTRDEYGRYLSINDQPSVLTYRVTGRDKQVVAAMWHNLNNQLSRRNGPAHIDLVDGTYAWYDNGKLLGRYDRDRNHAYFRSGEKIISAKEKFENDPLLFQNDVDVDAILNAKR